MTTATSEVGLLLERADQLAAFDDRIAALKAKRRGRLMLVSGEAGIGKTSLVQAFCGRVRGVRVLSGACDALHTPRVLGPFVDIADQTAAAQGVVVTLAAVARAARETATRRDEVSTLAEGGARELRRFRKGPDAAARLRAL